MNARAFVTGGGGPAGIAWEIGVIVGLSEAGINVREADLFLGTSGGACVATQMAGNLSLDEIFQMQVDPARQAKELVASPDFEHLGAEFERIVKVSRNANEILQRVGALALKTPTVSESERRQVILSRVTERTWPQRLLSIVAVDVASGERHIFAQSSGVDLIDAITASCAVPCIWPPATIGARRYMDGGSYSNENADLAAGFERVLVLAPAAPSFAIETLTSQVKRLESKGAIVEVISADEATHAALAAVGGNILDPSVRARMAQLGRAQGRRIAPRIAAFWQ